MKSLAFSLIFLIATANSGWAKTVTVKGAPARSIMEALSAAGFKITNIDEEWSGKVLTVETKALTCHYNIVTSPDDWMNNVDCYLGVETDGTSLKESLALAKSIAPYAAFEGGLGNRWLTVNAMKCSLVYNSKAYECKIEAEDDQN